MLQFFRKISLYLIGMGTVLVLSSTMAKENASENRLEETTSSLYQSIDFEGMAKPDFDIFHRTMIGYYQLKLAGKLSDKDMITLIDFRKSSNEKRMWTLDLKDKKILFHSLVSHGRNTGNEFAHNFSNTPNSNQSSLGFYTTGTIYTGKHGISMVLHGMEPGINDLAQSRAIVMHGAEYVSEQYIKKVGRLGRSFGCPAVPMESYREIIPKLSGGTLLFMYYPDKDYHEKTRFHNVTEALSYVTKQSSDPITTHLSSY